VLTNCEQNYDHENRCLCELHQVEIVIINQGEDLSFEEELAQDVLEIITVFAARLYGARSHRNKKHNVSRALLRKDGLLQKVVLKTAE
jgi:predicted site-specific integrase-resolvase